MYDRGACVAGVVGGQAKFLSTQQRPEDWSVNHVFMSCDQLSPCL